MDTLAWLLDSDPAIRHQVLRDLADAPADAVAAERSRVAHEGWGARLLSLQDADGRWDGGTYRGGWIESRDAPGFDAWTGTHFSVQALREYGVEPADPHVAGAVDRVRDRVIWDRSSGLPYFDGDGEACVDGVVLANGVYFGADTTHVLDGLLAIQLGDGGWNCESDTEVSSFHSTICVLEGLFAWEQAATDDARVAEVRAARLRGEEYLLERRLLWRSSTGELVDPRFGMLSYPTRWYYDVGRALDYFRLVRAGGDGRLGDAVAWLRAKADANGRWRLELEHEGPVWFRMDDEWEGAPSRWVTLRALRVLRWWDALSPR